MHFDKSVNRNIVLEKIQKNSCNVRGFPIEYQVLWHDSYEARGCCPLWQVFRGANVKLGN